VGRICAELVFGYNRHPSWDSEGCACCYRGTPQAEIEKIVPGLPMLAKGHAEEVADHQRGPCFRHEGFDHFTRMRIRLDGCLTGSRLAKDRAAESVSKVMIPEALDYPA